MLDSTVKASGASSLKFTIPTNSPADTSGSYFTNFSTNLQTQFGENSVFYIQWRQRFTPEFINTHYTSGMGWKQVIIGTGDKPPVGQGQLYSSCTALETVVQNTFQRRFPQMYNSCTGSASHGPFFPFEEPFNNFDFKLQNARPSPFCLYTASNSGTQFPPTGNCFGYAPNEWMTFQVKIQTGPRVNGEFVNSVVSLWVARENQTSELAIQFTVNLTAGSAAEDQKFGKVHLLPYHTDKSSGQVHATAFTWYDELIISLNQIADPAPPPPTGSTLATLASSMQSGQWANFTTSNFNVALIDAGNGGHSVLEFASRGHWDPVHKKIQFWGQGHLGSQGLLTYDEATNTWSRDSTTVFSGIGHGYQHMAMNPANGDLYLRGYNSGSIRKKPFGQAWQDVAPFNDINNQVAGALEWVPQLNSGAGGLAFADTGGVRFSNPTVGAWGAQVAGASGPYHQNGVAANGAFYFGGGENGSTAFWRLNANGTVTDVADPPVNFGVTNRHMVPHPNGVDVLMVGPGSNGGRIYRYNAVANTWTDVAAHQLNIGNNPNPWWIGVTIPEYGIVVWLCQDASTDPPFIRVYKP